LLQPKRSRCSSGPTKRSFYCSSDRRRRKEKVNFTEPYLTVGQMVILRKADYPALRDPKAMDRPKSRVG
jgi:ABC-type amino acid transport substrate-binding protein